MRLLSCHQQLPALLTGLAACALLGACGDSSSTDSAPAPASKAVDPESAVVNAVLEDAARKQAAGLGSGTVTVNGAWNYTGHSNLSAKPEARLVAIDVTIKDHTIEFDYDDIEIVDAALKISYGSDPDLALLNLSSGRLEADPSNRAMAPGPDRLLLIYGFPKDSKGFDLYYWGKKLNHSAIVPAETGWEIPFPKAKAKTTPQQ